MVMRKTPMHVRILVRPVGEETHTKSYETGLITDQKPNS